MSRRDRPVHALLLLTTFLFVIATTTASAAAENVARGKPATQSATMYGAAGVAAVAVDGNTNGSWGAGSVSHTDTRSPYWQVDLESVHEISSIRIWNRTDCCRERLQGFYIMVSETPIASSDPNGGQIFGGGRQSFGSEDSREFRSTSITRGRYVRIFLDHDDYLSLAEVEVFGSPVSGSVAINGFNVGLVKYREHGNGSFFAIGGGNWKEINSQSTSSFVETGRDEWSVYLRDPQRNLTVQLDLWQKKVYYTPAGGQRTELYAIVESGLGDSSAPSAVTFGDDPIGGGVDPPVPPIDLSDVPEVSPVSVSDGRRVLAWMAQQLEFDAMPYCYKQTYGRGVGEPLSSSCAPGLEKDGALCYPKCRSGYVGVGPVCWASCPSGFSDIGAFCQKPGPYGRGGGYPWKFGDRIGSLDAARARCARDNPQGCEKNGEIIYPKCRQGYHNVGCCVCSPNCPPGWTDTGTGCAKPSYGRGVGKTLACRPGLEQDGLLCYEPCKPGYYGVGPVCWQRCPPSRSTDCAAGCARDASECASVTANMVLAPIEMAFTITSAFVTGGPGGPAVKAAMTSAKTAGRAAMKAGATSAEKAAARSAFKNAANLAAENLARTLPRHVYQQMKREYPEHVMKWILKEQAKLLVAAEMKKDMGDQALDMLHDVAGLDPTGVASVIDAFAKPMCDLGLEAPPAVAVLH
jgi:hypothetical protein